MPESAEKRLANPRRCHGLRRRRYWADPMIAEPCKHYAQPGSEYCKFHGGHRAAAVALQKNFKARGTFLTGLPVALARRIAKASQDPELTSMRTHIALLDDRILQLAHKIPTKESAQAWLALQEDHAELEDQLKIVSGALPDELAEIPGLKDALVRSRIALQSMLKNFRRTQAERELWTEIIAHSEQRRRMAETETKRENFLQANLTSRQTLTLFAALNAILQDELRGLPEIKKRVGARLSNLLINERPAARLPAGEADPAEHAEYEILPREAAAEGGSSSVTSQ